MSLFGQKGPLTNSWYMSNRPLMPICRNALRMPFKEECTHKLSTANEALANYEGRDENPPEKGW